MIGGWHLPLWVQNLLGGGGGTPKTPAFAYVIGNSLAANREPWNADGVGYHLDYGDTLDHIYNNPVGAPPQIDFEPALWPEAFDTYAYEYVVFCPYNAADIQDDVDAIVAWAALQPDAVLIIGEQWPVLSQFAAQYSGAESVRGSDAYAVALIAALESALPGRDVRRLYSAQALNTIRTDGTLSLSLFYGDDLHMTNEDGTTGYGRYLQHNLLRAALGLPLLANEIMPQADADYINGVVQSYFTDALLPFTLLGEWMVDGTPSSYAQGAAMPTNGTAQQGGFTVGAVGPRLTSDSGSGYYITPTTDGRAFHQQLAAGGSVGVIFWLRAGEITGLDTKQLPICQFLSVNLAYVAMRLLVGANREFIAYRINDIEQTGIDFPTDEWVVLKVTAVRESAVTKNRTAAWYARPDQGDDDFAEMSAAQLFPPSQPGVEGAFNAIEVGPRSTAQNPAPIPLATDLRIGGFRWFVGPEDADERSILFPLNVEIGAEMATPDGDDVWTARRRELNWTANQRILVWTAKG